MKSTTSIWQSLPAPKHDDDGGGGGSWYCTTCRTLCYCFLCVNKFRQLSCMYLFVETNVPILNQLRKYACCFVGGNKKGKNADCGTPVRWRKWESNW